MRARACVSLVRACVRVSVRVSVRACVRVSVRACVCASVRACVRTYDIKLEAMLAHAMLSIPATKGFEIGSGFAGSKMRGSAHNDVFVRKQPVVAKPVAVDQHSGQNSSSSLSRDDVDGAAELVTCADAAAATLTTLTNNSGGIQGGISNGEPIVFRVAFKPAATVGVAQYTADFSGSLLSSLFSLCLSLSLVLQSLACSLSLSLSLDLSLAFSFRVSHSRLLLLSLHTASGVPSVLEAKGRHDPCVVPRAIPIVEAMAALVLADAALLQQARVHSAHAFPMVGNARSKRKTVDGDGGVVVAEQDK